MLIIRTVIGKFLQIRDERFRRGESEQIKNESYQVKSHIFLLILCISHVKISITIYLGNYMISSQNFWAWYAIWKYVSETLLKYTCKYMFTKYAQMQNASLVLFRFAFLNWFQHNHECIFVSKTRVVAHRCFCFSKTSQTLSNWIKKLILLHCKESLNKTKQKYSRSEQH